MKKIFILFLIGLPLFCSAQNRNNIWCFGDSSGIDFGTVANPTTFRSSVVSRGSCVSIADTNGHLLFYAHTRGGVGTGFSTLVFDSTNNLMQNGTNVKGEGWYNELLIIPDPGTTNEYFLFTKGMSTSPGFGYSKIDLSLNNGLGAVTQKNIILNSVRNADCLTGIKHGNGRDWWVISKYSNVNIPSYNRFYVFLITSDSIHTPIIQDLPNSSDFDWHQIAFNSDGTRLIQTTSAGLMQQMNFDRCTGLLSNANVYFPELLPVTHTRNYWSSAFSPDNSKFYATTQVFSLSLSDTSRVIQYDLNAPDIPASADTLLEEIYPTMIGAVKLAPDDKMYVTTYHYFGFPGYPYPDSSYNQFVTNLSVINYPDSLGLACDFQPYSFNLGGSRTYAGLPNNPNYDLGPLVGSGCDTLTSVSEITIPHQSIHVFYDSEWDIAFVNASGIKGKAGQLMLYDVQGKILLKEPLKLFGDNYTRDIDLSSFAKGLYVVSIVTDKKQLVQKFVKY